MKKLHLSSLASLLLTCTACTQGLFATHNTPADLQQMQQGSTSTTPQNNQHASVATSGGAPSSFSTPQAYASASSAGQDCGGLAKSRMSMYDRPDTYPISDQERHDAYQALYSSCMREHNFQVAGPVRTQQNYASLANLSPAAGGNRTAYSSVNAGNSVVSTSSVPGATVVVIGGGNNNNIASQLSSLSPSAGSNSPNATVVLVQSPQQGYTQAAYQPNAYQAAYAPPAGPLPVAVPVSPPTMARGYAPVAASVAPHPTMARPSPASTPQPSLAGADEAAAGSAAPTSAVAQSERANQQLENVLEQ